MNFTDEKEERIIRESMHVFKRFGIKSVNMDDIASRIGISKKTLYKYVSDKADLVGRVFEYQLLLEGESLREIRAKNLNAIDESFEILGMVMSMVKDIHPSVLFDMQKYHPELMRQMEDKRTEIIQDMLKNNLKKGVAEGNYRTDLNTDFITSIYVSAVEGIFKELSFENSGLSFQELYLELFRYHIRGIASDQGLSYLIDKINRERQINS